MITCVSLFSLDGVGPRDCLRSSGMLTGSIAHYTSHRLTGLSYLHGHKLWPLIKDQNQFAH